MSSSQSTTIYRRYNWHFNQSATTTQWTSLRRLRQYKLDCALLLNLWQITVPYTSRNCTILKFACLDRCYIWQHLKNTIDTHCLWVAVTTEKSQTLLQGKKTTRSRPEPASTLRLFQTVSPPTSFHSDLNPSTPSYTQLKLRIWKFPAENFRKFIVISPEISNHYRSFK